VLTVTATSAPVNVAEVLLQLLLEQVHLQFAPKRLYVVFVDHREFVSRQRPEHNTITVAEG